MNKQERLGGTQVSLANIFFPLFLPQNRERNKTDMIDWRLNHVHNDIIWVVVSSPNSKRHALAGDRVLSKLSPQLLLLLKSFLFDHHLLIKFQVLFFGPSVWNWVLLSTRRFRLSGWPAYIRKRKDSISQTWEFSSRVMAYYDPYCK